MLLEGQGRQTAGSKDGQSCDPRDDSLDGEEQKSEYWLVKGGGRGEIWTHFSVLQFVVNWGVNGAGEGPRIKVEFQMREAWVHLSADVKQPGRKGPIIWLSIAE